MDEIIKKIMATLNNFSERLLEHKESIEGWRAIQIDQSDLLGICADRMLALEADVKKLREARDNG